MTTPTLPHGILPLTDMRRPYTPSEETDVVDTWRRHGWTPPARHAPPRRPIDPAAGQLPTASYKRLLDA